MNPSALNWSAHAVPQTLGLHPYVPGKPIEKLLAERGLATAYKLASNENPYGPSPKAAAAIAELAHGIHRYPDGDSGKLKQALADHHGVTPANILPGNGSNEVLELVIRTFAGAGDEVVYSQRAFIVYALAAQAAGATGISVPEGEDLAHDLDAMAAAVSGRTKVLCIANPNNPTGTLHTLDAIQALLDKLPRQLIVLLDEAYQEYVRALIGDSIGKLSHPGLIICRTFSKAYGLAGLRIGYAVGDGELIGLINRYRAPFNISILAQAAAVAALSDQAWVQEKVAESLCERGRMQATLAELGVLGGNCHGNFVLLRHAKVGELVSALEGKGIIPRPLGPYGMREFLRISVGAPHENDKFLQELPALLKGLE